MASSSSSSYTLSARGVELRGEILGRRPLLAEFVERAGDRPLADLVASLFEAEATRRAYGAALEPVVAAVAAETRELWGDDLARRVAGRLALRPVVNTTNHLGFGTHPLMFNSDLMAWLPELLEAARPSEIPLPSEAPGAPGPPEPLVTLATSNIGLRQLTRPGGLRLARPPAETEGEADEVHLPLWPSRYQNAAVAAMAPLGAEELERVLGPQGPVARLRRDGVLEGSEARHLEALIEAEIGAPEILARGSFAEQVCLVAGRVWRRAFRFEAPPLVTLDLEAVTRRVLVAVHLEDPGSPLHRLLFDPSVRRRALPAFDDIPGCWTLDGDGRPSLGSLLFWWLDPRSGRKYAMALEEAGGVASLVAFGSDGKARQGGAVPLEPRAVAAALEAGRILPGMLLCFSALSFFGGLGTGGGFMQLDYTGRMKEVWRQLLLDPALGWERELAAGAAARLETLSTDLLMAGPVLAYVRRRGQVLRAGSVDALLDGGIEGRHLERAGASSLGVLHDLGMPGIYSIVVPEAERQPELEEVTAAAMAGLHGFDLDELVVGAGVA